MASYRDRPSEEVTSRWVQLEAAAREQGAAAVRRTHRPPSFEEAAADADANTAMVMQRLMGEPPREVLPRDDLELEEELGRGGMGVVYRATQHALERRVAVKRMRGEAASLRGPFVAEAQILGRLEHPSIVPVHALRVDDDGAPMVAMKLVEGASWHRLLHEAGSATSLEEHLRILLSVCNAVAYAHSRGIVHRDIKPSNVMVGELGQIYVMDWGIAVALDEDSCAGTAIVHRLAADGPAGTPGYMAPELAAGDGAAQDERTDVYLIGACLHEVLTRRPRHEGETMRDVLLAAMRSEAVDYPPDVPAELARICNAATARKPGERYASVREIIAAIESYLEHREANLLIAEASERLDELRGHVEAFAGDDESARRIHQLHAEIRFALNHALSVWPESQSAPARLADAARIMLEHAFATEDVALAERAVIDLDDPDAERQVEALRRKKARRDAELAELREEAKRRDWSAVAAPLGWSFIAAGLLGAGAAVATLALVGPTPPPRAALFGLWTSMVALSGVIAFLLLRGRGVPDNLVSPNVIGLWAAVAFGCMLTGAVSQLEGNPPFANAPYQSAMMAIGFTAMAMQTRRWLLLPAALYFSGCLVMTPNGPHNIEIFGVMWSSSMIGVGLALRMGVRLA